MTAQTETEQLQSPAGKWSVRAQEEILRPGTAQSQTGQCLSGQQRPQKVLHTGCAENSSAVGAKAADHGQTVHRTHQLAEADRLLCPLRQTLAQKAMEKRGALQLLPRPCTSCVPKNFSAAGSWNKR